MPPWGRPPGRKERERWERYQQTLLYEQNRFQELESEEEPAFGVPASVYKHSNRSVSDELYFNDGSSRYSRNYSDEQLAYGERYESGDEDGESDEDEDDVQRPGTQLVRRDSDQLVAQRALDRIDRAKAKGQASVNLTHEEIEALEKRYRPGSNSPERERKSSGDKGSNKRRSPSLNNSGAWTRKKGSRRASLISSSAVLAPAKQRTKGGKKQLIGDEVMPPGFMAMGPGGVPVYSPLGYYNVPPPTRRTASDGNRYSPPRSGDSSRSTSASSRRGQLAMPTYDGPPYPSARHPDPRLSYPPQDLDHYPPYTQYQTYPPPGQGGRRTASGPPEVAYSNVYRRPPPPTASRGRMQPSTLGNEYEPSSATSSDEDGSEDELARSRDSVYVDRREREPPQPVREPAVRARRKR